MKKFLLTLVLGMVLGLIPVSGMADTLSQNNAAEYGLNLASPNQMAKQRLGTRLIKNRVHSLKGTWNFAVDGGASASSISLKGPDGKALAVPNKAIIRDCIIDVLTAPTSAVATSLSFSSGQGGSDLKAAATASSYTGLMACIPVGTAATAIKMTSDRVPVIQIGTANPVTAGKINVLIDYELSE